jgi:hypothetical protein
MNWYSTFIYPIIIKCRAGFLFHVHPASVSRTALQNINTKNILDILLFLEIVGVECVVGQVHFRHRGSGLAGGGGRGRGGMGVQVEDDLLRLLPRPDRRELRLDGLHCPALHKLVLANPRLKKTGVDVMANIFGGKKSTNST